MTTEEMRIPEQAPPTSLARKVLREPTLHFVVLAALLFAVSWLWRMGKGDVIVIDRGAIAVRIAQIEASRGFPLTEEERREVEVGYVEERVLVREALAMGLESDPRIDDILVQKMLHVLSGDVIQPTDAELEAFFQANLERYTPEPSVTLDELVIATSDPLPEGFLDQLRRGVAPEELATDVPFRVGALEQVSRSDLVAIVGISTATLILSAQPGEWVGPRHTVRGQHWYRVKERAEPVPPLLDVIRERVRLDWIGEQELARLQDRVTELRSRYTIEFTGGGEGS